MLSIFNILLIFKFLRKIFWKEWIGPIFILIILFMMILPLSSFMLDIFFTFNITMSIIVLLISFFIKNTLEFSIFPTILLFLTLFRLSLNIASTRIILLKGHIGTFSAGHVIKSFGSFLIGDNFLIGIIIFIILIIINFIVITKGSSRIAEVSARFILDSMPGKQMAIDSDLNSGLINIKQAKIRRLKIEEEANFYGAMDGSSKFIRGDAISSILIMIVNICGGLVVGLIEHNMTLYEASRIYTTLTIGDGLVAQIPALVISISCGVILTRVSNNKNINEQIINQIFFNSEIFILSSLILIIFGLIPGMPNLIFLLFAFLLIIIAYFLYYFQYEKYNFLKINKNKFINLNNNKESNILSWKNVTFEDIIKIELDFFLYPMINNDNRNNLFFHISKLRLDFAKKIGFLPEKINIVCNNHLLPYHYRILIHGIELGSGKIFPNKFIAINKCNINEILSDHKIIDPIFGYPAFWITPQLKYYAKQKKYHVMNSQSIIVEHLNNIMYSNLKDLFGRLEVQKLLKYISIKMPKLTEELIPNIINITCLHKILKNLLFENIPIRDMRTILESLIEHSLIHKNSDKLTSLVRLSLNKFITQNFISHNKKIYVINLDPNLENSILNIMKDKKKFIQSDLNSFFLKKINLVLKKQHSMNLPLILLVRHKIRMFLSYFLKKYFPRLIVLSDLEISNEKKIFIINTIKLQN
ncbi:flagellar biosynthesis protein FlhA [Buchnera aphidicola]|uniref:Flagellar biosynthesis protein FlhA n=1 Tax=Buchnera aphidicola (Therioaphis trifolii) TaxID=1241884 RepID=A0A4D6YB40_9GAMM|nr:flagellar biosynthesis protein FlhA [Buchnera aphidicola]QCI27166.1 flagellar biosynthesis protein FlhA [Buchnera aphidicola (Therioaphis trifolii)]